MSIQHNVGIPGNWLKGHSTTKNHKVFYWTLIIHFTLHITVIKALAYQIRYWARRQNVKAKICRWHTLAQLSRWCIKLIQTFICGLHNCGITFVFVYIADNAFISLNKNNLLTCKSYPHLNFFIHGYFYLRNTGGREVSHCSFYRIEIYWLLTTVLICKVINLWSWYMWQCQCQTWAKWEYIN